MATMEEQALATLQAARDEGWFGLPVDTSTPSGMEWIDDPLPQHPAPKMTKRRRRRIKAKR